MSDGFFPKRVGFMGLSICPSLTFHSCAKGIFGVLSKSVVPRSKSNHSFPRTNIKARTNTKRIRSPFNSFLLSLQLQNKKVIIIIIIVIIMITPNRKGTTSVVQNESQPAATTTTTTSPWATPDVLFEYYETDQEGTTRTSNNNTTRNNNETDSDNNNNNNNNKQERRRQIGGAAAVGGITGLVLAGPVIGLVAAGGAAATAAKGKGPIGDMVRATGNVVSNAGERIKQFDQEHKVTHKTSQTFVKGCNWISKKIAVAPKK